MPTLTVEEYPLAAASMANNRILKIRRYGSGNNGPSVYIQAGLHADDSGVTPFDEACSRIWWRLAQRFPEHPIPPACLAATVELRGQTDLTHEMAAEDGL